MFQLLIAFTGSLFALLYTKQRIHSTGFYEKLYAFSAFYPFFPILADQ